MYKRECLEYVFAPLQSSPVLAGQHCASVLRYSRTLLFSGRFLVAASHLPVFVSSYAYVKVTSDHI